MYYCQQPLKAARQPGKMKHSIVLLLLVATATTASAAADSQLFVDWLAVRTSGKAKVSSYYSAVESSRSCLVEQKVDGCSVYDRRAQLNCTAGFAYSYTLDADMACCQDPAYTSKPDLNNVIKEAVSAGRCTYTQTYLEGDGVEYVKGDSTVLKVGQFTGTCTLNSHAETCGGPACDGQIITIQGDIFKSTHVAFEAPIASPTRSQRCSDIFTGDCQNDLKKKRAPSGAATVTKPQSAYEEDDDIDEYNNGGYQRYAPEKPYDGYDEPYYGESKHTTYYTGTGLIFMGTFYTTNRAHGIEYDAGIYQLAELISPIDPTKPLKECPPGYYSARGSEVTLTFLKAKDSYKA